uniref:VWFA domain-containing protein n=1 Tax=Oryza brachyantha TaxID=4533 RepID=J3N9X8_ORYBR
MELLRRAMEIVINKLGEHDRLAIVPVQAAEKDELLRMNAEGRTEATTRVHSLVATGDNKLSTALKNAAAILDGRSETEKRRAAGFIILISDGDDGSVFREKMSGNYSVHAFGFRDAHNAKAMHYIADNSTGTYGILNDDHDGITEAFTGSVDSIVSVVAVDTEVDIWLAPPPPPPGSGSGTTATLSAIESGRFRSRIKDDKKSGFIIPGALQAGAVRSFLVYVDNVGKDERSKLPELLKVGFKCKNLSSHHAEEEPEKEGRARDVQNQVQVVVVSKGDERSRVVAAEIVCVEAFKIVDGVLKKYTDNGNVLAGAIDELRNQWGSLKASEYGAEAGQAGLLSGLDSEIEDMVASILRCSGMSYILSWQTRHSLQHHTSSPASGVPPRPSPNPNGIAAGAAAAAPGTITAAGAHHAAHGVGCGGGERKRKYQYRSELEMIEQRLADWSKGKCELPPMHHDGECADHMTTLPGGLPPWCMPPAGGVRNPAVAVAAAAAAGVHAASETADLHFCMCHIYLKTSELVLVSSRSCVLVAHCTMYIPLAPVSAVGSDKVQLSTFPRLDAIPRRECHARLPVLVRVTAPATAARRAPVDLVALLDISGSGGGAARRLDLLRNAMAGPPPPPRLAIVPFHSSVVDATGLLEMSVEGRSVASRKVQSLAVAGGTKLFPALNMAVEILEGRRREEKAGRVGAVILIFDGDDRTIFREAIHPRYPVHAFGFRGAHDARAVHYVADHTSGVYGVLNDEHDRLTDAFAACVRRVTSIVAVDAQVDLTCGAYSGASILAVESGGYKSHVDESGRSGFVYAGSLCAGDVKNFVVYVDVDREADGYIDVTELLTVHGACTYLDAARRKETVHLDERMAVVQRRDRIPDVSCDVAAELKAVAVEMNAGEGHGKEEGGGAAVVAGTKRRCVEMDMIEERLAYWSKVKHDLPLMFPDHAAPAAATGTSTGDHVAAVFRDASLETINRAMFHDVYLAALHASTVRRCCQSSPSTEHPRNDQD